MSLKCVIFDLDGVLVDTSVFHAKAWADLVRGEGLEPPVDLEDRVKGISRMESLKIALGESASKYSAEELETLAAKKNACYLEAVKTVKSSDLYPGARALLDALRASGIKIALGSASKNARAVLDGLGITKNFDVISDGTTHQRGKPHPDVFLGAAWMAGATPTECIVVEDAPAGITAALRGGFVSVGLGDPQFLEQAHTVVSSLEELCVASLEALHKEYRIPELTGEPALPSIGVVPTEDFAFSATAPHDSWDRLSWAPLRQLGDESDGAPVTQMKMQYSDTGLYVLVHCAAKTLNCTIEEDQASLFTEDVVEVFIMPDPWQRTYLEYEISPLGRDLTLRVVNHLGSFASYQPWNLPASQQILKQVFVHGGEQKPRAAVAGWTMEIKIPFAWFASIAVVPPKTTDVWYGNVCRIDTENSLKWHLAWSLPEGRSFHDYARFGKLLFE